MKTILKYILIYLVLILICFGSLFLTSLIPSSSIKENVSQSADLLKTETNRKIVSIRDRKYMLDNFTDALMINTAFSIDSTKPVNSFILARKNYIPNITQVEYGDAGDELKSASKYETLDQVGELYDTVNSDITESFEYARYWHGYLIFLRPLLLIFDILQIRIILIVLFHILALTLLILLYRKINNPFIIAIWVLGLIAVDYQIVGYSLQCAPIFLVMMISCIIITLFKEKIKNNIGLLFFIIGASTSFFDFLTAPIITLGMPLIVYFLIVKEGENKITSKETFFIILKTSFTWLLGYVGIWASKWIITDILYGRGIVKNAITQFIYRSGGKENFTIKNTFLRNFHLTDDITVILILLSVIYVFIKMILLKYKKEKIEMSLSSSLPYLIIAAMPIAWYIVLRNHSYLHAYFTFRTALPLVIAFPIAIAKVIKKEKIV